MYECAKEILDFFWQILKKWEFNMGHEECDQLCTAYWKSSDLVKKWVSFAHKPNFLVSFANLNKHNADENFMCTCTNKNNSRAKIWGELNCLKLKIEFKGRIIVKWAFSRTPCAKCPTFQVLFHRI